MTTPTQDLVATNGHSDSVVYAKEDNSCFYFLIIINVTKDKNILVVIDILMVESELSGRERESRFEYLLNTWMEFEGSCA